MVVTANQIRQLRDGATAASGHELHRLARLFTGLGDLAQMILDGSDLDLELTLPDVIDLGCTVARDVSRSDAPGEAGAP